MISCGEPSGDLYAGALAVEIRRRRPDAAIFGLVEPDGAPPAVVESCARCHGRDGNGRGVGAFPKLAGQQPSYLYAALRAYARGTRHSGIMEPVASGLPEEARHASLRYYASLPPAPDPTAATDEGLRIWDVHDPTAPRLLGILRAGAVEGRAQPDPGGCGQGRDLP